MIEITIPGQEFFDESSQEFIYTEPAKLQLEHSLISISKWEQKWHKSYLSNKTKTLEESLDYIRCMCINKVKPEVFKFLTAENLKEIDDYIGDPMTAVYFFDNKDDESHTESVTNELIYYWMISNNIPFDPCEKWHLNRLIALIRVCALKNTPPKKMSRSQILSRNKALNEARCKRLNTKG